MKYKESFAKRKLEKVVNAKNEVKRFGDEAIEASKRDEANRGKNTADKKDTEEKMKLMYEAARIREE